MNIIQKGKRQLIILSIIILILSIGFIAGAVVLIVSGAMDIAASKDVLKIVLKMVFGVILFFVGAVGLALGIIMLWTGGSIKAKFGNIAELNTLNGTVNMKKCPKCGSQIAENDDFCGVCGKHLEENIKCPHCGKQTESGKKYCVHCGKKIEK